ncbi:MAG: hypothetical protein ACRD3W_15700, partial [Terriglobales bacterium]
WIGLTYTSTAIFLAASGMLLALTAFENANWKMNARITALLICFVTVIGAGLLRPDSARLAIVIFCMIACVRFIRADSLKTLAVALAFVALLAAANEAFSFYDSHDYARDPQWATFVRFNDSINKIGDYRRLVMSDRTKPVFDSIGWTENDMHIMRYYEFAVDPQLFSPEKCERLLNVSPWHRADLSVKVAKKKLMMFVCNCYVVPSILLALLILPFAHTGFLNRRSQLVLFSGFAGLLATIFCLMKLETRITLPVFAWLAMLAVYYCDASKLSASIDRLKNPLRAVLGACLIGAVFYALSLYSRECAANAQMRAQLKSSIAAMRKLHGTAYVLPISFEFLKAMSPFEVPQSYFGAMNVIVPYLAVTPLKPHSPYEVANSTWLPLLAPGVYSCFDSQLCTLMSRYYLEHRNMHVRFRTVYEDGLVRMVRPRRGVVPVGDPSTQP